MLAFVSPFTNTENPYIDRQKDLLVSLGYEVRPFSVGALLRGRCLGLLDRENVVLVHWLENRLFKVGDASRKLSFTGALSFGFLTVVLRISSARVIYFIHDHEVHDVATRFRPLARRSIKWLREVADIRVVHDPSFASTYSADYLPHPLYREPEATTSHSDVRKKLRFLIVGAIRPYKCIREVLEHWPTGHRLHIAGRGSPEYLAELRGTIQRRRLGNDVTIDSRFLSDDEFLDALREYDVVLLPHKEGANLVSGAFFAAIGSAAAVVARQTPFLDWAMSRFPNVFAFSSDDHIPRLVEEISKEWPELSQNDMSGAANEHFGTKACLDAYRALLVPSGASSFPAEARET